MRVWLHCVVAEVGGGTAVSSVLMLLRTSLAGSGLAIMVAVVRWCSSGAATLMPLFAGISSLKSVSLLVLVSMVPVVARFGIFSPVVPKPCLVSSTRLGSGAGAGAGASSWPGAVGRSLGASWPSWSVAPPSLSCLVCSLWTSVVAFASC